MKLILIRPNYKSHIITAPLGIGYLASYLRREGFKVGIIDGLRDNLSDAQIVKKILEEKPDGVGISCLTAFYNEVKNLSRLIKDNNLRCIIGGVHPTFLPYSTLVDTGADFVVCGEGEKALLSLLQNKFDHKKAKGVYALDDLHSDADAIERAEVVDNLDELPFPDWEQIRPDKYPIAPHGAFSKGFPVGIITTTRGCVYECTFCSSPGFYGRRIRSRSPENVIEEIKYLIDRFAVKEIHFEDDNLAFSREHLQRICQLLLQNNIRVPWACPNGIRADSVDEELLQLMAKSGCYALAFGVESADPGILRGIKKHETLEIIRHAIKLADEAGIACQGFFIFGLPGETHITISKTIRFAKNSKLSRAQFLILDILPGSQLWNDLRGKFCPRWDKRSFADPEWIPEGLTRGELIQAQRKAFWAFYCRLHIIFSLLKLVKFRQIKFLLSRLKNYRIFN